jgi:hypothetical protein
MSLIRAVQRADLPAVARLYELVMRSGRSAAPSGLADYFERVLIDQPWADPEIPSLVHVAQDGSVDGFQGSSVRRARFDGRAITIACAGQCVAHPDARRSAVGARLVRAYLAGPQELTITDTANDQMRQIWTLSGGDMVHASCVGWARVLRPWQSAGAYRATRARPTGPGSHSRILDALDRLTTRWVAPLMPPTAPDVTSEPLTPAGLVQHLPVVAQGLRLHLDYDEAYVTWLFRELGVIRGFGTPVARLVRDGRGRVLGWYIYYLAAHGISRVLQIVAADRRVGLVVDHLFTHAWANGAAAVVGRVEPRLLEPLGARHCLFRYAGGALAHSREPEILDAVASGRSLLTRLDSEWWIQDSEIDFGSSA